MSNTKNESFPLIAGVLSKMLYLPFGRSRWISRYFVLLDSELRFYKDEHAESPLNVLNLRDICQIVSAPTCQHPYCFRLEPKQHISMRPWIIDCKSKKNMDLWVSSIQSRIMKYNDKPSVKSMIIASPEVYRLPTLPLRCTNQPEQEEEQLSLLTRRKKSLAPILTAPLHNAPDAIIASPITPSPTGAILGCYNYNNTSKTAINFTTLISPSIIDQYVPCIKRQNANNESPSSPTYLMYKKKFHL